MSDRFVSQMQAWSGRPGDPNDHWLAEVMDDAANGGDVALFGIPFDGAVPGRPGARGGPAAIRAALAPLKLWDGEAAFAPSVADWGDVRVPYGDVAVVLDAVEAATLDVLQAGAFPLALGGDHSVTFPLVKAHEGRRGRIGVINLDAHLDVRDVVDGRLNSGQSFSRLMDLGLVAGANLVEVGIRPFANSAKYVEKAAKAGVTVATAAAWRADPDGVIEDAVARASDGMDGVYLSVDIDVLDQAHGPGVSAPTPDGVDSGLLLDAVRRIARDAPLVGADVVELAPNLDRDGITARAAAVTVLTILAGLSRR